MSTPPVASAPQIPLELAGQTLRPGEARTLELDIAHLYTRTPITIPVHVIHGKRAGPRLFVCAGIHGDELNGVEIIGRVLKHKPLRNLTGTLFLLPVINVHGFISHSRYFPDGRDMNRSFPGSPQGSLASRVAAIFMKEIVGRCTHGIDLHTASGHRYNLPQIRAGMGHPETAGLARTFGAPVILDANLRDGSLRQAVAESGKPLLLYEAGEALRFDEISIRIGVRGVLAVMRKLGMLPKAKESRTNRALEAKASTWIRAPLSGVFHPTIKPGQMVSKDQYLASISDPLGELHYPIRAPAEGVVIGMMRLPLVNQGDALVHLAHPKSGESRLDWLDGEDFREKWGLDPV